MPLMEKELLHGHTVRIAYTDEEFPPTHGDAFQKRWNPASGRESLSFYDSTVEYMRNEWTEANARSAEVQLDGKHVMLFFDERTRTWNSPEALDVDHKTQWLKHLENKEVWSREDAMLAYNDVGNLRTVPSTYNRGRTDADAILDDPTKGVHSPEWKMWVDTRMRFDAGKDYPAYDPDLHGVERSSRTTDVAWTAGVTREGLKFDEPIKTIWLDHALKEAYAGEVKMPDPDHPGDRSKDHAVQLFRCVATGQLVTRGGLDIDHEIPFATVLEKMLDMDRNARELAQANGDEPPPPISKADVMDLYNNPENLRLMSRSANSSHEWEHGVVEQLYDPELDGAQYLNPEPTVTVVGDDEPIIYDTNHDHKDPKKRIYDDAFPSDPSANIDDELLESDEKRTKREEVDGQQSSARDEALRTMHPDDFLLFARMMGEVAKLDPGEVGALSQSQQENLAMVLVYGARGQRIDIDHVVFDPQSRTLFGVQGDLASDTGKTYFPIDDFKNASLDVTAGHVAEQRQQAAQTVTPVQPQHTPAQHM